MAIFSPLNHGVELQPVTERTDLDGFFAMLGRRFESIVDDRPRIR